MAREAFTSLTVQATRRANPSDVARRTLDLRIQTPPRTLPRLAWARSTRRVRQWVSSRGTALLIGSATVRNLPA